MRPNLLSTYLKEKISAKKNVVDEATKMNKEKMSRFYMYGEIDSLEWIMGLIDKFESNSISRDVDGI